MDFIKAQWTRIPQVIPTDLSSKTVLITGGNAGLGFEAAREVLPHKPERLILAVRDLEKGEAARKQLDEIKDSATTIETRKLDQSSFKSVTDFVKGLNGKRVDYALLNAGVWNTEFIQTTDQMESDLQVNAIAPALLSLLLLPNLRSASSSPAHLTFVSSGLHATAKFPERNAPNSVLSALNDSTQYQQGDRYPTSKTLSLLWARELAQRVSSSQVVINSASPGFCKTELTRNMRGVIAFGNKVAETILARSAPDGARCLVDAVVTKGEESHGKYLSEMQIKSESTLVTSEEGEKLQKKVWAETIALLQSRAGLDISTVPT